MKKTCVALVILVFVFLGCGGKDRVKPSADSILATEALNTANAIKTAYENKNENSLRSRLAPELAESISKELFFEKAELSFTPRLVNIKASTVMININWQGTWVIKGNDIKNLGVAVFVFEGSPMKLIRVDGDNPFLTPLAKD